jgi:hypothetical protein
MNNINATRIYVMRIFTLLSLRFIQDIDAVAHPHQLLKAASSAGPLNKLDRIAIRIGNPGSAQLTVEKVMGG